MVPKLLQLLFTVQPTVSTENGIITSGEIFSLLSVFRCEVKRWTAFSFSLSGQSLFAMGVNASKILIHT